MHPTVTEPSAEQSTPPPAPTLVGCILSFNAEHDIERAVSSVLAAADAVLVVDSGSHDRTRELAADLGATVIEHPFESYPAQRNWALDQLAARYGDVWMLSIDDDEWLSPELAAEIRRATPRLGHDADAYQLKRRVRFDGRILRHGGFQATWITRLVRVGSTRYEDRLVNEHLALPAGARIGRFEGWLEHSDVDSWSDYVDKHNRYSTLEAEARIDAGPTVTLDEARRNPALRRRFLREQIWNRLPASARPAVRFVQVYVLARGFLDRRSGFRRAVFEAWQEMMTDLKAEELQRQRAARGGHR